MKQNGDNDIKCIRFRTVRNIFLVYLFISAVTDRYEIFAAICASFPFIIPVLFDDAGDMMKSAGRSLLYGVTGCIAAVLFMLVMKMYRLSYWLVPALYAAMLCAGYYMICKRLTEHKRIITKCIISVSVCFLSCV